MLPDILVVVLRELYCVFMACLDFLRNYRVGSKVRMVVSLLVA